MAYTAVENSRIYLELYRVLAEDCPAIKQVFLDGSATYANNLTDLNTAVAAVTAVLFNTTAPTISP
jgi:hypothetical protein